MKGLCENIAIVSDDACWRWLTAYLDKSSDPFIVTDGQRCGKRIEENDSSKATAYS